MKKIILILLAIAIVCTAQTSDLYMTNNFQTAYKNQSRSLDGLPGPAYWQNRANYTILISLDPATRVITGTETIQYLNHSPDILNFLIIHLFPNVYKKGTPRDFIVTYEDETDGVLIQSIQIDDQKIDVSENSKSIEYLHNDFKLYSLYQHQQTNLYKRLR